MNNLRLFIICFVTILVIDQLSKFLILTYVNNPTELIHNIFYFRIAYNTGAAWSLFAGNNFILGVFGLIVVGSITVLRKHLELNIKFNQIIFGTLCGGIIGNVIDRFTRSGVVDFIDINLGFYRWPTFNFADSAICLSILTYFVIAFYKKKSRI